MLNNAVKFHLPRLEGTRLICTEDTKVVDGHVGKAFVVIYNARVFNTVYEACSSMRGKPEFSAAMLNGRDLTALFFSKTPVTSVNGVDVFRGILVQNRETSGRAIRLTNLLLDTGSRSWSADAFYSDTRIPHIAVNKLNDKISAMADVLGKRQPHADAVTKQFEKAMGTVSVPDWGIESKKNIATSVTKHLGKYDLPKYAADAVVAKVYGLLNIPTFHDIYSAMLSSAGELGTMYGLQMRNAAFSFLMRLP